MPEELKVSTSEATAVGEAMANTFGREVARLVESLKMTVDQTIEARRRRREIDYSTLEEIVNTPAEQLDWMAFEVAMDASPDAALQLWERVRREAQEELQSGVRGATVVTDRRYHPLEFARYLALRQELGADWQARGGIEEILLDQLAQLHTQYSYWLSIANGRTLKEYQEPTEFQKKYDLPRVDEQEAEEHALAMADRCHRMFMRTLRNLREMRRFPVIVQNAGQVNVAANGGQQINLAPQQGTEAAEPERIR